MKRLTPEQFQKMQRRPIVEIVGVPMDLGGNRRGVDMGPSGIRYAGLANKLAEIGYRVREGSRRGTGDALVREVRR